jgi:MtN3 and saliva related transmembrane protein
MNQDLPHAPEVDFFKLAGCKYLVTKMDTTLFIGYIAGILTTLSFVPQVIRSWKLKETRDISLLMLLLFGIGVLLWTLYGIWINSFPIIAANIVTFVLILMLWAMKLKFH